MLLPYFSFTFATLSPSPPLPFPPHFQPQEEITLFEEARDSATVVADEKLATAMDLWEANFVVAVSAHRKKLEGITAVSASALSSSSSTAAAAAAVPHVHRHRAALRNAMATAEAEAALTATSLTLLRQSAQTISHDAIVAELDVHESIETMLDMFDSSLGELRAGKLAMHEVFFRGVEGANVGFAETLAKAATALADAVKTGGDGGLDEELALLLTDREALNGACMGASEARVARVLKREAELRAREEKRCAGAVVGARTTEHARNRRRVEQARALGAACAARVDDALKGVEGVLIAVGMKNNNKLEL